MKKISWRENIHLTEIYRRLYTFKNGDVNKSMMMLAFPSEVKTLLNKGILISDYKETPKVLNWYNLGEKGKLLMGLMPPMKAEDNLPIFEGKKIIDWQINYNQLNQRK